MANTSILSAFERMWQHVVAALGNKADIEHSHNYAGSSSSGGSAISADKLSGSNIHIDGVRFDGTANICHYGVCSTASLTVAKTATIDGFNLVGLGGSKVVISFENINGASAPTLNINGTGDHPMVYMGNAIPAYSLQANIPYEFILRHNSVGEWVYDLIGVPNLYATSGGGLVATYPLANSNSAAVGSFACGYNAVASGGLSLAVGSMVTASGPSSCAFGSGTKATGYAAHADGCQTIANAYQHASGKYNADIDAPESYNTQSSDGSDAIFLVGYGTATTRANAFRISSNGKCRGASSFSGSGADFAELFEWADGNQNNEDRRGLFVTLDGEKIRLANADDDYIGVISGAQAFIGNTASEEWQGKYLTDVFGTRLSQEVEVPEQTDEITGEVIAPAHTATQFVVNPDYNPDEKYIMRENRKEWGIVGLLGQVVVIDDGTCVVGGYAKPSTNGVAMASDSGYRVMKRIDENHIKVLVK